MGSTHSRYDRSERLFGAAGQQNLRETHALLIGVSGLGTPVAQHLALLGIGHATLAEPKELDETNRNRFIGARHDDPVPGSSKVSLAARLIREINPDVYVTEICARLEHQKTFDAVKQADWIFGCFDQDGPRAILNELCAAYDKPYIDLASDIPEPGIYGGRVFTAWNGNGCLHCLGVLDEDDVRAYLSTDTEKAVIDKIYGIDRRLLHGIGPSVSPVNGVIASLAATEFMVAVTEMREPTRLITYRGDRSRISVSMDAPAANCPYCKGIRSIGAKADVERFLRMPHLQSPVKSELDVPIAMI